MKLSKMKIECPVCQTRINQVRADRSAYWAECPHQCIRLRHNLAGEITSYLVKVHIDNKDYRFHSHRFHEGFHLGGNAIEQSTLHIYKLNPETQNWEYREIIALSKYTDFEEVVNNTWRFVQRLLNVKVFA